MINNIPENLQNSIYTLGLLGHSKNREADIAELNREADLIHLSLVYLSESFNPKENQDDLKVKLSFYIEEGYSDEQIIERLTKLKNNPLTREEAEKFLKKLRPFAKNCSFFRSVILL